MAGAGSSVTGWCGGLAVASQRDGQDGEPAGDARAGQHRDDLDRDAEQLAGGAGDRPRCGGDEDSGADDDHGRAGAAAAVGLPGAFHRSSPVTCRALRWRSSSRRTLRTVRCTVLEPGRRRRPAPLQIRHRAGI
jgi:hypothetical protein